MERTVTDSRDTKSLAADTRIRGQHLHEALRLALRAIRAFLFPTKNLDSSDYEM